MGRPDKCQMDMDGRTGMVSPAIPRSCQPKVSLGDCCVRVILKAGQAPHSRAESILSVTFADLAPAKYNASASTGTRGQRPGVTMQISGDPSLHPGIAPVHAPREICAFPGPLPQAFCPCTTTCFAKHGCVGHPPCDRQLQICAGFLGGAYPAAPAARPTAHSLGNYPGIQAI